MQQAADSCIIMQHIAAGSRQRQQGVVSVPGDTLGAKPCGRRPPRTEPWLGSQQQGIAYFAGVREQHLAVQLQLQLQPSQQQALASQAGVREQQPLETHTGAYDVVQQA